MIDSVSSVLLECPVCDTRSRVPVDAKQFSCRCCETTTFFCACPQCGAASGVTGRQSAPPARWRCRACDRITTVPLLGKIELRRADEMLASLGVARAAGASTRRPVTGFVVVGSAHCTLALGLRCAVRVGSGELSIHGTDFPAELRLRYGAIDVLEISGRGADRMREGLGGLSARLARFEPEDTVLRVTSGETRVVVKHASLTRHELGVLLASGISRWNEARALPV